MNVFYSGAAILLAGTTIAATYRFAGKDKTIEAFLCKIKPLTPSGVCALESVSISPIIGPLIVLSRRDIPILFTNSRLLVKVGNRARLCVLEDRELNALFGALQDDHRKLRLLIVLSIIERIVGRLGLGYITMYASVMLWTYAEELEILSQISEKCGPSEGDAIRAIL